MKHPPKWNESRKCLPESATPADRFWVWDGEIACECVFENGGFTSPLFGTIASTYWIQLPTPPVVRTSRDLTGNTFGRLEVISRHASPVKHIMWLCRCRCGTEKPVRSDHLLSGKVVGCGCAREGPQTKTWARKGNTAPRLVEKPVEPPPPQVVVTGREKKITLVQYEQSVRAFMASGFPKAEAREMALIGVVVEGIA